MKLRQYKVYLRSFHIWQELGYHPWAAQKEVKKKKGGEFYRGAFDSIPFLNDDAKRTFTHLLLRPGYMMRDYIHGAHERYLSPLTALIIFFSFFALISALLKPYESGPKKPIIDTDVVDESDVHSRGDVVLDEMSTLLVTGWKYLHLDQYPEEVHSRREAALATLEGTLRSQGFTLFIGNFFVLWLAMAWALRKFRLRMSAWAAVSAYYLCQTSFFMLFTVVFTMGQRTSASLIILLALMLIDLRQLLGLSWKKSFGRSLVTGISYVLIYMLIVFAVSGLTMAVAYFRVS